jgi:hypothetical protein
MLEEAACLMMAQKQRERERESMQRWGLGTQSKIPFKDMPTSSTRPHLPQFHHLPIVCSNFEPIKGLAIDEGRVLMIQSLPSRSISGSCLHQEPILQ